ncbi:MAG: DNA mismatch repair protein MutS, partial [Ruminococcus sp.]
MAELSPMMQQYKTIKENNKDCILFFRLGDFYEMFFEDAKLASKELELTLTGRDCGLEERAPMCGVPFHSCDSYIARLVQKGYKVAICEQMENPAEVKGLVKRDIVRVITPGTVMESNMLDESKNNYISCIYAEKKHIGVCFCDISTGQLYVTEISGKSYVESLKSQLSSYNPREILIGGDVVKIKELPEFIKEKLSATVEMLEDDHFAYITCQDIVKKHFSGENYELISDKPIVVSALGGLISYLSYTQKTGLERINSIELINENQFMKLDFNTQRNLELTQTMLNKEKKGSLLWVLDKTKTSMGKRLLRSWIEKPLLNVTSIINRQSAVEELVNDTVLRLDISAALV